MKANKLPLSLLNDRKKVGIIIICFIEMHKLNIFIIKNVKDIFKTSNRQASYFMFQRKKSELG